MQQRHDADFEIKPAKLIDWPPIWSILKSVIETGANFVFPTDYDEKSMRSIWFGQGVTVFKVLSGEQIVGSYFVRPNHHGPGAHIANAAYATHQDYRRRGIGDAMCRHSLDTARDGGFAAMQFNEVIAMNTKATRLYERNGFEIAGRIPDGFIDPKHGKSDLLIFYRTV